MQETYASWPVLLFVALLLLIDLNFQLGSQVFLALAGFVMAYFWVEFDPPRPPTL